MLVLFILGKCTNTSFWAGVNAIKEKNRFPRESKKERPTLDMELVL